MLLYLIAHAEAQPVQEGQGDFDRPLTERGRMQASDLGTMFAARNLSIDAVIASPMARAHQTASQFLANASPEVRPITCDLLLPDRLKPRRLSKVIAKLPPAGARSPSRIDRSVAVIGHPAEIGRYLEWLLGAVSGAIPMTEAKVACLDSSTIPTKASGRLLSLGKFPESTSNF